MIIHKQIQIYKILNIILFQELTFKNIKFNIRNKQLKNITNNLSSHPQSLLCNKSFRLHWSLSIMSMGLIRFLCISLINLSIFFASYIDYGHIKFIVKLLQCLFRVFSCLHIILIINVKWFVAKTSNTSMTLEENHKS